LEYSLEIFAAAITSRNLRHRECWSCPVVIFTYCWVMVEPPPTPPVSWRHAARPIPPISKPGLE
jgi:hypothetical protein